ncbi:MAG: thiamine phosphate synthase [Bacteroidota bacterium]|nr:thiamine phosphate synthase [Bacteroidota bacterium]
MKIIIYTPEIEIPDEVEIISQLLDLGACHLHIRKPHLDDFSLVDYMEKFDPKYYPKMISTSLIITKEFELEGYHFTREAMQKNEKYNDKILEWLHANNKISSVSAHSEEEIKRYAGKFKHIIVSPVFKSISKAEHQKKWNYDNLRNTIYEIRSHSTFNIQHSTLFSVGGMDIDKIEKIKKMHFDGFGLLGALWKNPEISIEKFKTIISYDSRLTTHDS